MQRDAILEALEGAAAKLAVKVSYESLHGALGAGGLCRVRGEYRVIIEKRAQVNERIATLAQALSLFDVSGLELVTPVRNLLRQHSGRRANGGDAVRRAS